MMDPKLWDAYHATDYVVDAPGGAIALRVGKCSPTLDRLLSEHGADQAVFITAWNPQSVRLAAVENGSRQEALVREVRGRGYAVIGGHGAGAGGDWPAEDSLLVVGMPAEEGMELGMRFGQLAVVFARVGGVVELLWC
jgi:Protein of unknown function (DUF3293)